ncbi:hypothetical protein [Sphaerisporangium sp. TRM90804]|uniref:COG4315 family predicted lipoprotein n=1 Tax=Sphaerisporangium sp. TRM90804 TaxID=3031113 RepID=UPI00244680AA|nr:hypothetical protein [Sphaerisporangium sp. TRM90804]MDH2423946.1 hypothetical protein [Sphaerisporangium sp. TRM90804]
MRRLARDATAALTALTALTAGACGGTRAGRGVSPSPPVTPSGGTSPSETGLPPTMPTPRRVTVKAARTKAGEVLVGENGRTLYVFGRDRPGEPTCLLSCAAWWPPAVTRDEPGAESGVRRKRLGAVERDGVRQVTYGELPLYYFNGDRKPGDVYGRGRDEFGGRWYAVRPDGARVG